MAGEETGAICRIEKAVGELSDLGLGAADVRDEMLWAKHRRELLHEVERRKDGNGEEHDLTFSCGCDYINANGVNGAH